MLSNVTAWIVIVSIKAKTVKSGGFLGNLTVQIKNQEQYCQQQDKKYKKI